MISSRRSKRADAGDGSLELEVEQEGFEHVFEPSKPEVLDKLLPQHLAVQIYRAMLESTAAEHGARMSAMDAASRNAKDLIGKITLPNEPRTPGNYYHRVDGDRLRRRSPQSLRYLAVNGGINPPAASSQRYPLLRVPSGLAGLHCTTLSHLMPGTSSQRYPLLRVPSGLAGLHCTTLSPFDAGNLFATLRVPLGPAGPALHKTKYNLATGKFLQSYLCCTSLRNLRRVLPSKNSRSLPLHRVSFSTPGTVSRPALFRSANTEPQPPTPGVKKL